MPLVMFVIIGVVAGIGTCTVIAFIKYFSRLLNSSPPFI